MSFERDLFLPVTMEDMRRRGWEGYDFLVITGDAYVDHPSFGTTIIARVLPVGCPTRLGECSCFDLIF